MKKNQDQSVTETKKKILTLTNSSTSLKVAYEFDTTTGIVVMATATENMMNLYVRELVKKPIKVDRFVETVNRWFKQNMPPSRLERIISRNVRRQKVETPVEQLQRKMKNADVRVVESGGVVSLWCAGRHFVADTSDEAATLALEAFGF